MVTLIVPVALGSSVRLVPLSVSVAVELEDGAAVAFNVASPVFFTVIACCEAQKVKLSVAGETVSCGPMATVMVTGTRSVPPPAETVTAPVYWPGLIPVGLAVTVMGVALPAASAPDAGETVSQFGLAVACQGTLFAPALMSEKVTAF